MECHTTISRFTGIARKTSFLHLLARWMRFFLIKIQQFFALFSLRLGSERWGDFEKFKCRALEPLMTLSTLKTGRAAKLEISPLRRVRILHRAVFSSSISLHFTICARAHHWPCTQAELNSNILSRILPCPKRGTTTTWSTSSRRSRGGVIHHMETGRETSCRPSLFLSFSLIYTFSSVFSYCLQVLWL